MAYMDQEKKAKIAAALKLVVPKDWKYSLAVRHHSTIVFTLKSAPVDLIAIGGNFKVNVYHVDSQFTGTTLETFEAILKALNTDNHDRSDIQTDYFDVGHYVDIRVGDWDKPFVNSSK